MAKNLLGGTTKSNFARGEAPPADSYEWAAAGSAPKKAPAAAQGQKVPVIVATMRETLVLEKKPKKWKYLGIGAAVGGLATYLGLKIRSY